MNIDNGLVYARLPKCKTCGYASRTNLPEKEGQWWYTVHCTHPHITNDPSHTDGLSVRQAYRKGRCSTLCPLLKQDGDTQHG